MSMGVDTAPPQGAFHCFGYAASMGGQPHKEEGDRAGLP